MEENYISASFVEENIHRMAYCIESPTINSPKTLVLGKFFCLIECCAETVVRP